MCQAGAAEYPVKPLMLVAGDEAEKKPVVMELVPRPQLRLRAREDEVRAVRGAPVP